MQVSSEVSKQKIVIKHWRILLIIEDGFLHRL